MNIQKLPDISNIGLYNPCQGSLFYVVPMASENLCINPSFEYDTSGWSSTGTITRTSNGYSEHFALQAVLTANQSVSYTLPNNPTSVTHAASIYILNTSSNIISIQMNVSASSTLASRVFTIEPNRWQRIQVSFIGNSLSTTLTITALSSCTIKLDACQIEVSSVGATTYFDGNTLGTQQDNQVQYQQYGWFGDVHASTSYRNRQTTNGGQIIDLQSYGFQLTSISGAGNPTFDNAILTFASTDGGTLQDTIVPPRDVIMLGRISASNKTELHQKLQQFMQLFERDQVSYYQARSWRFQHMNGRVPIGQEITFNGLLVSVVAADITDQLSVDVTIQLKMIDPYFYGHDVSVEASDSLFYSPSSSTFDWIDSYQVSNTITNTVQGRFVFNNSVFDKATYNRFCYIVGAFTQITDTVTSTVYNHSYMTIFDSYTNTFIAPSAVINAQIWSIDISPNGKYLVIGGDFTTIGGTTCNRIAIYTIATNTFSRIHPTYIGVDNTVRTVKFGNLIDGSALWNYAIYLGGTFLNGNVVGTLNRVAKFIDIMYALGTGVNGTVLTVCPDENANYLYLGGSFTASVSAVNMRRIGAFNLSVGGTYTGFNVGLDQNVTSIVLKTTNQVYIGGGFENFLSNATGAVISRCSQLLKGVSRTLSNIDVPYLSSDYSWTAQPSCLGLRLYQDGVVYTRQYNGPSRRYSYYYNETNGITTIFPVSNVDGLHYDAQLNRMYYGGDSSSATPKPVSITSDSTARCLLFARIRLLSQYATPYPATDSTYTVFAGIKNYSNGLYILTSIPTKTSLTLGDNFLDQMIPWVNYGDVIIVDSRIGKIESQYTELIQYLNPTSSLYSLYVIPGVNIIQIYLLQGSQSLVTANPEVVLGYTQTYQNIFDGMNRI